MPVAERGARFPVAGTHAQAALEADAPIVVEDATNGDDPHGDLMRRYGFRSGASVRIGMSGDALGVLGAYSSAVRRFDEHDEHFLQAIANVLADAITRRRIEDDMSRRALTDALTGLPNRVLLMDRLAHWREAAMRSGAQAALLFLDLDHFKVINDSLGHDAGDDLLRAIGRAARRVPCARRDTVARFGGDEFVVLCEDVDRGGRRGGRRAHPDALQAAVLAAGALARGRRASIGVALSDTTAALRRRAAHATPTRRCTAPRIAGAGRLEFFDAGMHASARRAR